MWGSVLERNASNDSRTARTWNRPAPSASPDFAGGVTSDAGHNDLTTTAGRKTTRRRREVAQILQRSPADDRLRKPHPVPRSAQLSLEVRELQASVSPTPFVVDPGGASVTASQSCALQICIRHRRVDVKSSTGSEHTAPRRGYFFFFAATLRLAGAFFFAAVFAFVAFFTILPSWPKPSGGVYQHLRESQALHLDYYKRKEKKIFLIKETCTPHLRARPWEGAFPLAPR